VRRNHDFALKQHFQSRNLMAHTVIGGGVCWCAAAEFEPAYTHEKSELD
jgi:hypothetical protein